MDSNSNIFKFHGNNMIVRAKGPNMDKKINISSSFCTNVMSSTRNMPRNFEKQSCTESVVSQKSFYYRRETSPATSVRSEFQPRNFYMPFNQGGFSQRSTYNGRGVSPASVRTFDSNVSVATDIAQAISNGNFSRHEWRIIQKALDRKRKSNYRKKAEMRRKMQVYSKSIRNRSGDDSGEQGSNSSISSDDCMSVRTGYIRRYHPKYKENIPQSITSSRYNDHGKHCTSPVNTHNPYVRDTETCHSENLITNQQDLLKKQQTAMTLSQPKQNFMNSLNTYANGNVSSIQRNILNSSICSTKSLQNSTMVPPKDRFKSRFQFPSQRFNNTITPIDEHERNNHKQPLTQDIFNDNQHRTKPSNCADNDEENDDIFIQPPVVCKTVPKKDLPRQKRGIESLDDVPASVKKKYKSSLNHNKIGVQKTVNTKNINTDFVFTKPQFPLKKSAQTKPTEKMISKSAEPFSNTASNVQKKVNTCEQPAELPIQENEADLDMLESTQLTSSNISQRPSFMKRKLFTQTLDVTERKNNSSESLNTDSPQSNIYSALSREKHRTRKLVSSQSLLSRDINQDDNNLLDLIHKIVPPDQVNMTNIAKSTHSRVSGNTAEDSEDKWDITSIISTCNNASVSDTYTDDEILKVNVEEKNNKTKEKLTKQSNKNEHEKKIIATKANGSETIKDNKIVKKCSVVVQKIPTKPTLVEKKLSNQEYPAKKGLLNNNRVDTFWNSDIESDYECTGIHHARKQDNMQGVSHIATPKQSSIKSYIEILPKVHNNKISKNIESNELDSLTVKKNDSMIVKALKKQTSKQLAVKPAEAVKKVNNKVISTNKSEKIPEPKSLRTRRQINLSLLLESAEKSHSVNMDDSARKTKRRQTSNKPTVESKREEKAIKKQSSAGNKKVQQNHRQQQSDNTNKQCPEDKSKTRTKNARVKDPVKILKNDLVCKVLRSREIDLSSSFNSDKFELTGISRARKSRTPSKRISFNKSGNAITSKTRLKGTKT